MKLQRLAFPVLAFLGALTLFACALSPEDQAAAKVVLDDMLARGQLTQQQYQALLAALTRGGWATALTSIVEVALSVGLSLLGVRQWRGGITERKGFVPVIVDNKSHVVAAQPTVPPVLPTPIQKIEL